MGASRQSGILVTQAGVDARYAADYEYVFNSNWPSLAIAFDSLITIPASGSATVAHNLGFYPFTQAWVIQNGISVGRLFGLSESFESTPQAAISIAWDTVNYYLVNSDTNSYQVNIKGYNLDISQSVDYTLPKPPVIKQQYDPTYGIKVVKYGKTLSSTDLRDFILHSRAQSPAVLSVVTQTSPPPVAGLGSNYALHYINPAGYMPWVFAFTGVPVGSTTQYSPIPSGGQQSGFAFFLNIISVLAIPGGADGNLLPGYTGSIVALRDPLLIATQKTITYNG